jgi:hypothetical protein
MMREIGLDGNVSWANGSPGTIKAATNTIMKLLTTICFIPFLLSVKLTSMIQKKPPNGHG